MDTLKKPKFILGNCSVVIAVLLFILFERIWKYLICTDNCSCKHLIYKNVFVPIKISTHDCVSVR